MQGVEVSGKVYLGPKKLPGYVVCIACGMHVSISNIDIHHTAHTAHRDHTLPQAMEKIMVALASGE